jgi:photosystem II stability/assembly factor-like uncharacterized protein
MNKSLSLSCLAIILLLPVINLQAQWKQLDLGSAAKINAITVVGSSVLAGTNIGTYRSIDTGASWENVSSNFTLCFAVSANSIFAGTAFGVILSTDNGNSWNAVGPSMDYVNALAVKDTNIFAGTLNSGIFRSTNNGRNWTAVNNGLGAYQTYINALEISGTKLLAGTDAGLCSSTDNGNHWVTEYDYERINCIAVHDSTIFVGTPGGMLRLAGDGTPWEDDNVGFTLDGSGIPPSIFSVAFDGLYTFAGTSAGAFVSSDNGRIWTDVNNGLPSLYRDIFSFASIGSKLFASTWHGVFLSANNGSSWIPTSSGIVGSDPRSIAGIGSKIFVQMDSSIFVSSDNGTTWAMADSGLPNRAIWSITVIDSDLCAVTNGGIFLSSNDGKSWRSINGCVMDTTYPTKLIVSGSNLIVATQSSEFFLSTDKGASWKITGGNLPPPNQSLTAIGSDVFAGFYEAGVYRSTDNGVTWTNLNDTLVGITSFASIGSSIYAARPHWAGAVFDTFPPYWGGVFRSTDNGKSWMTVSSGLPKNPEVTSLTAHGQNVFVAAGYRLYYYSVNGDTWTDVSDGLPSAFSVALFINDSDVFIGEGMGGIWRRPLSQIVTGIKEPWIQTPAAFWLAQNYPNPFNPTTVIKYQLPTNTLVSLEVYDILGRRVKTLVSEHQSAGAHSVSFNAGGLSTGVYFYRLTAGGFIGTKKLMVIK